MSKRVMVIDDDDDTVKFLSVLLDDNGYESVSARNGKEGLEKLREDDVDLIILDVMMPHKTGFVLFNQLKKDELLCDIPVIMLTGVGASLAELDAESDGDDIKPFDSLRESMRKQIRNMRKDGALRPEIFMDKPINPKALIDRIHALIEQ